MRAHEDEVGANKIRHLIVPHSPDLFSCKDLCLACPCSLHYNKRGFYEDDNMPLTGDDPTVVIDGVQEETC